MNKVEQFEHVIAEYFGSPYAIAVDCCTHAIELCLRHTQPKQVTCPTHTYISIPFTFKKLGIDWKFREDEWKDFYYIGNTKIVDAAVLWRPHSYICGTMMCLSFQYKKHLNLGRGGMILLDDYAAYKELKKMRYDGRMDDIPWAEQDIDSIGYHYYMTPETAWEGIEKFYKIKDKDPKHWTFRDYPDLTRMKIFK